MDGCLGLWLGQEGHAEGSKIGPEKEVEGMEGVRPSCGMLHVFLPTILTISRKLHSTVIAITTMANFKIILW